MAPGIAIVVLTFAALTAAILLKVRRASKSAVFRLKNFAQSIFVRAEERGAFRRLPAFDCDYLRDYPELRILEENYPAIREECLALLEIKDEITDVDKLSRKYTSGGIHAIRWKSFMFKSGKFLDGNCRLAPHTAALLRRIPNVYTAFFSILDPHQYITPHCGPWKGIVRYHLGVVIPNDNREKECWLRINTRPERDLDSVANIRRGDLYHWKNGAGVMFDDTFVHDAANESDEVRVVLWLDIARKMPLHLHLLNKLFIAIAHTEASLREIRTNARVRDPRRAAHSAGP